MKDEEGGENGTFGARELMSFFRFVGSEPSGYP